MCWFLHDAIKTCSTFLFSFLIFFNHCVQIHNQWFVVIYMYHGAYRLLDWGSVLQPYLPITYSYKCNSTLKTKRRLISWFFLEAHRRKKAVIWKYNRRFEIKNEDIKLKNSTASAIVRRRIIFVCLSENGDCREKTERLTSARLP